MFKGMQLEEFNQTFRTEDDCKQYLFDIKWKKGYECRKCYRTKFWKGRTQFHARCSTCGYDESITSHTVFHKIQIPLLPSIKQQTDELDQVFRKYIRS
ncbi:MAG: IS1595 family transposase [Chitinophagaceae bacterium]|nr:MAG: IS1595 family transposase [Chitinophagaceae bacterium]